MQEAERSRRSTTGARGDGSDSMAGGPLGLAGRKSGLLESATSGVVSSAWHSPGGHHKGASDPCLKWAGWTGGGRRAR